MIILLFHFNTTAQLPEFYLKTAAENNPELRASYLEFEAALKRIPQASSLPDPNIMIGYTVWPSEPMQGMEKAVISLNQMFPWFGTLKAAGNKAALQAEASYQSFIDQRNKLFFQLTSAWYPLYELKKIKDIEDQNIKILTSYKNIATRNFESGNSPMVDVLRADLSISEAKTRLAVIDDKEKSLLAVFNSLLNRDVTSPVEIPDSINVQQQVPYLFNDSLLTANPKVKEMEFKIEASKLSSVLAEKQGLPNIGLGLEYMFMGTQQEMSAGSHKKGALMPMLNLSIPIFRGKYKAALDEANLLKESFELQKENLINQLQSEYSKMLSDIRQQEKLLAMYNEQIKITGKSLNLLISSYSNSGNNFEEVLRMQQLQLEYEKQKASALTSLLISQAQLNYLTANSSYNDGKK